MKTQVELTFIKRYYGLFSETRSLELPVSSVEKAQEDALKSDGCFGYIVNQREYVEVNGKRFYNPEVKHVKNVVFGKVMTRKQVEEMDEGIGKYIVLQHMDEERVKTVARLRTGRFISADDFKDVTFVDC